MPWVKVHGWALDKFMISFPGYPDRLWSDCNNDGTYLFTDQNKGDIVLRCVYCNQSQPIVRYPDNHIVGEIRPAASGSHDCPDMPPIEEDPDASWDWRPTGEEPAEPDTDHPE